MNINLLIYIVFFNIITFIVFGLDKYFAIHNKYRISEKTLLSLCIIGGSIGGFIGMHLFRHKTKKYYFKFGIPVIIIFQIFFIYYLNFKLY